MKKKHLVLISVAVLVLLVIQFAIIQQHETPSDFWLTEGYVHIQSKFEEDNSYYFTVLNATGDEDVVLPCSQEQYEQLEVGQEALYHIRYQFSKNNPKANELLILEKDYTWESRT